MSSTLRQGQIERLDAGTSAVGTAKIPAVQNDELVTVTVDQIGAGANAVDGPGASTNDAFARWDGVTGLLMQDSTSTLSDTGDASFAGTVAQVTGKTDFEKFLGIQDVLLFSAGTWTTTRVAQGDYVSRKTAADDTTVIGIDVTETIRAASSKGLSLASFDYIFRNITAALDAHTVTLDRIEYTDSAVVSVNTIALTGALGTGTDADPQIDAVTIDTPLFNNTTDSKYVLETTVDAATTSVYDFIGVVFKFTRNDL